MKRLFFLLTWNVVLIAVLLVAIEFTARQFEKSQQPQGQSSLQDPYAVPAKEPGEFRVFTYGGSTVYGNYFPEIGFVAQLKYQLVKLFPERKITVFNFASRGADTAAALTALKATIGNKPDLVIVLNGHNEFLDFRIDDALSLRHMLTQSVSQLAVVRLFNKYRTRSHWKSDQNALPQKLNPFDRNSAVFKAKLALYKKETQAIIDLCRAHNVPLFLGTQASNIVDWPPVFRSLAGKSSDYETVVTSIRALINDGKLNEAERHLQSAMVEQPQDAMLIYLQARIAYQQHQSHEAKTFFTQAKDLDPFPWRVLSATNDITRDLAKGKDREGIFLIDTERELESRAVDGLIGFDLVSDNCHLTPAREAVIADQILHKIVGLGLLKPASPDSLAVTPADEYLREKNYLQPGSAMLKQYLVENAKYSMKTPFLNFDIARHYLEEARRTDGDDWEVWANLATLSFFEQNVRQARQELDKAQALHTGPLDLDDRGRLPYLRLAMRVAQVN